MVMAYSDKGGFGFNVKCRFTPALDSAFTPTLLACREYEQAVERSGNAVPVMVALEREDGLISTASAGIFADEHRKGIDNAVYISRLVQTLLWLKGGWRVRVAGPDYIVRYLQRIYAPDGTGAFDADFMSRIYLKDFVVESVKAEGFPQPNERPRPLGGHLDGCRIGFDAGGSDRKVSAVMDGKTVFSEEVVWHPKTQSDPEYHRRGVEDAIAAAAARLPRVDAIGVSAAGIYIGGEVRAASLFMRVPKQEFDRRIRRMFLETAARYGVPIEVANDGDAAALAGAMLLGENRVLGLAMGTSLAAGYIDAQGQVTGWLNELAFAPVDVNPLAAVDEWSGDAGVGGSYFSQDGVARLAKRAGISLDGGMTPAEKLDAVQRLMAGGDERAAQVFSDMGVYLGYSLPWYERFYDIGHVLLLGRVTSGEGGLLMQRQAQKVLAEEFPRLGFSLVIPDEASRRVGQAVAAASLPKI